MNNKKTSLFTLVSTLLLSLLTTPLYSFEEDSLDELENFFSQEFVWDDAEEEFYQYMMDRTTLTPEEIGDIVLIITSQDEGIVIQNVLQKSFYKRTNPVNVRPLHDLPSLQHHGRTTCYNDKFFGFTLFYNQTRRKYFTKCSPFIDSYLAISDPDFIEELDRIDNAVQESPLIPITTSFDIPTILPLFKNIKLEERRLGGMFELHKQSNRFEWRVRMPLYYIEHNFFLTDEEQAEIFNAPFFRDLDLTLDDFLEQYMVNDLFGIGDLRLEARWDILESDCILMSIGAELMLPTGTDFANGLVGSKMINNPAIPDFDLLEYICLGLAAKNEAIDFAVSTLDRLARIAAATKMGDKHVGLGAHIEYRHWLTHDFSIFNKARIHYLIPKDETRFFRATKNPADFDRNYENPDEIPQVDTDNLKFLSQEFVNTLFPYGVCTQVNPGITIQWTIAAHVDTSHCHAEIGYDLWFRGHETLHIDPHNIAPQLDICEGVLFSAHQHKVFGKILWDKVWCDYDWRIGIVGDLTFAQTGIGKDWTLGLDLGFTF